MKSPWPTLSSSHKQAKSITQQHLQGKDLKNVILCFQHFAEGCNWGCNKPGDTLGIFPLTSRALAAVTQHILLQTFLCFMWLLTLSDPIPTQWTHVCILLNEKGSPISKELMRREIATKSSCDLSFCYTLTKFHEKNQWHHSIKPCSDSWWFDFAPSNEASDRQKEHLGKITESLCKLQRLTWQDRDSAFSHRCWWQH